MKSIYASCFVIVIVISLPFIATGCGKSGSLYLPDQSSQKKNQKPSASEKQ
jgi:predicted small lipoprotein YifL